MFEFSDALSSIDLTDIIDIDISVQGKNQMATSFSTLRSVRFIQYVAGSVSLHHDAGFGQ